MRRSSSVPPAVHAQGSVEPLVVLETSRPPRPVVRYLDQVMGAADCGITFRYADGEIRALNMDVLHLHPRRRVTLIGTQETTSPQRLLAVLGFLLRVRGKGIPIVRTVQGPPEEKPRLAQRLLDHATALFIVLDPSTTTPSIDRTIVIPHVHYRERYIGYPRSTTIPGRIVCFTSTATTATLNSLAESSSSSTLHDVEMRIVGAALQGVCERLQAVTAWAGSRLSLRGGALSDGATVQEICAAELVLVPRFETMDDLQIAFTALSLDRPLLLPNSESALHLQDEVGSEWVRTSDTPANADEIHAALKAARERAHAPSPNMDRRDPRAVSAAYAVAFRRVIAATRRTRS